MTILEKVCSVAEAAAILGVSEERVLQFIRTERLYGKRLKREYVLSLASVRAFVRQPRGRPVKP